MPTAFDYANQLQDEWNKQAMAHQQTLGQALQNQKTQQLMDLYRPKMQADIGLEQNQGQYLGEQAKYYPDIVSAKLAAANRPSIQDFALVNTPNGVVQVNKRTGEVHPIMGQSGKPLMPLVKGGLSLTQSPGGQWTITQGGMVPAAQGNDQGGVVRVPASGGTSRSNAGATLRDQGTGQAVSVPTQTTGSRLQRGIVGANIAIPELMETFSDMQGGLGSSGLASSAKQALGSWEQYLPGVPKSDAYQKFIARKSTISTTADSLLNNYGLNATTENRKAMETAITPVSGDTRETYANRVANVISGLIARENLYQRYLKGGISLSQSQLPQAQNMMRDKLYNILLGNEVTQSPFKNYSVEKINEYARKKGISAKQVIEKMKAAGAK